MIIYKRKWKCLECDYTEWFTYEDILEIGTPYCTKCENGEMELTDSWDLTEEK